jgi:hypothetical protein
MLFHDFSATRSHQPLGALRREWRALSKQRSNADDSFSSRPKGGQLVDQKPKELKLNKLNPGEKFKIAVKKVHWHTTQTL